MSTGRGGSYVASLAGILCLVYLVAGGAACPGPPAGEGEGEGEGEQVSGTYDPATGLALETRDASLSVPPGADPSNTTLTMRQLTTVELRAGGLPPDSGFEIGVALGPDGTTFANPVEVSVTLPTPTVLDTLPVLTFDETEGVWGGTGLLASVSPDGTTATADLMHFSSYQWWNPPLPPTDIPIGNGEIIAGTGLYDGMPFNLLPNYTQTSASLTYSDFGDVFGLALINLDLENPTGGDNITLTAGLHATQIANIEGAIVGYVTPAGGLGGPSIYQDSALTFNKPVSGIMFLRKSATQWKVDVYCAYEGGMLFGQATGDL